VGERWLTYDEMVEVMHLTKESAKVLTAEIMELLTRMNRGGRDTLIVPSEYLEVVVTKR
jgi:hypothetical protein